MSQAQTGPVAGRAGKTPSRRSLDGATVLVTGANRGIGLAFVEQALARGAARVYAGGRDAAALDELDSRFGSKVTALRLDVTDPVQIAAAANGIHELDLLVSNAGMTASAGFFECSDEEFRQIVDVNFLGPVRLTRAFAPALARRRGGLLHVLSIAALMPAARAPVYHGSKAGLMMAAFSMRAELAALGIGMMLAYPGFVATRMTERHEMSKASPASVAAKCLDAWEAGLEAVFPDAYAEAVRTALLQPQEPGRPPDAVAIATKLRESGW